MKFVVFSDFDGTIAQVDTLDTIITDVYSYEAYKSAEASLLNGSITFETYLFSMFQGIQYDIDRLANCVDPTFESFYLWGRQENIGFHVVSSGFKTIIHKLLPYVKENVHANDILTDGPWQVVLHGIDRSINKNEIIDKYRTPTHTTIYIGDGLSDFKVIGHVDVLFCKKDSLLHIKCQQEGHAHIPFETFSDIQKRLLSM